MLSFSKYLLLVVTLYSCIPLEAAASHASSQTKSGNMLTVHRIGFAVGALAVGYLAFNKLRRGSEASRAEGYARDQNLHREHMAKFKSSETIEHLVMIGAAGCALSSAFDGKYPIGVNENPGQSGIVSILALAGGIALCSHLGKRFLAPESKGTIAKPAFAQAIFRGNRSDTRYWKGAATLGNIDDMIVTTDGEMTLLEYVVRYDNNNKQSVCNYLLKKGANPDLISRGVVNSIFNDNQELFRTLYRHAGRRFKTNSLIACALMGDETRAVDLISNGGNSNEAMVALASNTAALNLLKKARANVQLKRLNKGYSTECFLDKYKINNLEVSPKPIKAEIAQYL